VFEPGRAHAGQVTVADIGIDVAGDDGTGAMAMLEAADVAAALPPRRPDAHKWKAGVLVVGGSGGMTGAPMFVSHAAMRAGAGIVWCALPGEGAARGASGTEVITRALPVTPDGVLAAEACDAVLAILSRFKSLALGPGLGTDPAIRSTVLALVAEARVPMVLDADGLNALNGELGQLRGRETLGAPTVLTPHEAEYARLAGEPVGDDRVTAARRLAERSACVVLLKGPGTVVADPGGRVVVNPTGNAALATAGSGDALTGTVAAFLARGMPAFDAAASAAWVHGRTAERVSERTGTSGAIAVDLVTELAPTLLSLTGPDRETP
jgi:NAD(P)H-hydrate epimerase